MQEMPSIIFAKPPVPGRVKTRLGASIGMEVAAHFALAFLRDTWDLVRQTSGVAPVLATTDVNHPAWDASYQPRWDQEQGDLGERMERMLRRGLLKAPAALVLGADSPGMPQDRLMAARTQLASFDAVIGPAGDGGFYLLGLRSCPEGLLADLPWSQSHTYEATRSRLEDRGMRVSVLPAWFDVDTVADLERLRVAQQAGDIVAAHTAAVLRDWR